MPKVALKSLSFKDAIQISKIKLNKQSLTLVHNDSVHHILGYLMHPSIVNDSIFSLTLNASKKYEGFSQSDLQSDITSNGSYASIKEFLPTFGYDSNKELNENRQRFDNGLEKLNSRMASVNDTIALTQHATTKDAEKVTGSITISTPKLQTAVAPGIFVEQKVENNRNYATYYIETPSLFNWYVGSAMYKNFKNNVVEGIKYQIYAKPSHAYNIEIYEDAIKKSLIYFKNILPNFHLKELRLYEKHHWSDTNFNAFANAIVISEKHGWVANTEKIVEKSYVYQTVASQIATLWVANNFDIANVQGANMLRVALPEALALNFIEKELGYEAVKHIIKKKQDKYGKDRNNEPNVEPSLLYDDGADYLAVNKGAVTLYNIIKKVSFVKVNRCLQNNENKKFITFTYLYNCIKPHLSKKMIENIEKKQT